MTKAELDSFRQILQSLRSRLTGDVSHLADEALRAMGGEASGSLSNAPLHMADLGTDNYEQEFTLSLLQNQEQALQEITLALDRIERGTYGICELTGEPIETERLEVIPWTRYSFTGQHELEKAGLNRKRALPSLASLNLNESPSAEDEAETEEETD